MKDGLHAQAGFVSIPECRPEQAFPAGLSKPLYAILGEWELAGVWRQTSGLPASAQNDRVYPTNWNLPGFATQIAPVQEMRSFKNTASVTGQPGPNLFRDPKAAYGRLQSSSLGSEAPLPLVVVKPRPGEV